MEGTRAAGWRPFMPRKPAFLRPEGASPCPEAVKCAVGFAMIEALLFRGGSAAEDRMIGTSGVFSSGPSDSRGARPTATGERWQILGKDRQPTLPGTVASVEAKR